jgi:streptogramin lyase
LPETRGFAPLPQPRSRTLHPVFDKDNVVKIAAVSWAIIGSLLCSPSWGADTFKHFKMPAAYTLPTRVAIDKADSVWFIESNLNKIGRFQPAKGVFTEHNIPTPSSAPTDITISNTGKLWLTEANSNQIGVLDPVSLTFKEYNIPTIASNPGKIASDLKGNIWFTEFYGNKIGMFDPRKETFREYPLPKPTSRPSGIVADKKGIVWFLETEGNKLARLNPQDGAIQEFELPRSHETPRDLAIDRAGVLWFGGHIGRNLMSFNPATKKFKTFLMPSNGAIESLTVGSDGKIFCTLLTSGRIAVFDPATSAFLELDVGSAETTKTTANKKTGTSALMESHSDPDENVNKSKPNGIATDSKGDIWFVDKDKDTLIKLDARMAAKLWVK